MSGRGDRGRGRGGRGRGGPTRGVSTSRGGLGGGPPQGGRGGPPTSIGQPSGFRGGPGPRGSPPSGGRGGPPASRGQPPGSRGGPRSRGSPPSEGSAFPSLLPVAPPPLGPATLDTRTSTIESDVERFKEAQNTPEHPLRPGFGTAGAEIIVRANFFALKLKKNLIIHEYNIRIRPETGLKRFKSRIIECLERLPQYAQYKPYVAHDKTEKMVAARELPQPLVFDVTFIEEGETSARENAKRFNVEIIKTAERDTSDLENYVSGDPAYKDTDIAPLISALGLIVNMKSARTGVRVRRSRHFFGSAQVSLGNGIVAWRGYSASVRPVLKTLMVNINVYITAFIESKNMAQAIMDFQRGSYGATPNLRKMFGSSTLRVRTRHLGYRKTVLAIGENNANQERFLCEELGGTVTVAEYFQREYPNMLLEYPDLPLVNLGNKDRVNWVPAEFCDIIQGIPFRGRLNDAQTSNMLQAARHSPKENFDLIRGEGLFKLGIKPSSRHVTLRTFGIAIGHRMTVIPARILPPPGLSYGNSTRPRVVDGSWNLNGVRFHSGGAIGRLTILVVREQGHPHPWKGGEDEGMWEFVKTFTARCQTAGMTLSTERPFITPTPPLPPGGRDDPSRGAALNMIRAKMEDIANMNPRPTFILVILKNRDNYIYPGIKLIGDVELGIHTVCMQLDKALGRGNPKKQDRYFSSVALKINTKLGGINHKLDQKDMAWLQEKRTMVVGARVTHPGPTSADGTPSLAAVVASIGPDFMQFPCSMELQTTGLEMIENFEGMMIERLKLYEDRNKALPECVILFRSGVSESQFNAMLELELPQIREAFGKVYKEKKKPQLMICICGKRHHVKFYPADGNKTRNGNTRPGTVVDKGIGDIYRFDFYLQAHAASQGMARVTHYTVVYDEIGFSADTIQLGTYAASYSYACATKAISLVPAAYYSGLACERGRLYLNDLFNLGAEKASSVGTARNMGEARQEVVDFCLKSWNGIHERVKNSMFYI